MSAYNVAPLVGVWIEILYTGTPGSGKSVAPLVGVWIEIFLYLDSGQVLDRRSPRGSVD